MKHNYVFIAMVILICSCDTSQKKAISEGVISESLVEVIPLNPVKDKKILLSEIVKDIKIVFLETTEECSISDIRKVECDDGYFILNEFDKIVYSFDLSGKFRNRISSIGQGPEEILFPFAFAINKQQKEIWLSNNFQYINVYNYSGVFKSKRALNLFFNDFILLDDGTAYFHTGKRHNFNSDRKEIPWELWKLVPDNVFTTYFEYDPQIFYNGGLTFETISPFNQLNDRTVYHYVFSDTIYSIQKGLISPEYYIDFKNKKAPFNFNENTGDDSLEFLKNNNEYVCFVQNVIENDSHIVFNYLMGLQMYNFFIDKRTKHTVEGILINDLLEAPIRFFPAKGSAVFGCMNAFEIAVSDKAANYFDELTLEMLQNLSEEDNPILIYLELNI